MIPNRMEKGTAILTDFDRKIYTAMPTPKQKMAVLVPDWNIPHKTMKALIRKKILALFCLFVIPQIKKATAADAAWQP